MTKNFTNRIAVKTSGVDVLNLKILSEIVASFVGDSGEAEEVCYKDESFYCVTFKKVGDAEKFYDECNGVQLDKTEATLTLFVVPDEVEFA
ncbi:hypothetical protein ECANGB1_297 [Enterospora canceri]|uniref:Uncharacterized protein n=1 Tax=Enterospora canceri TaxID=1081671 RepID=A0A1Y1S854_9MICR|nr:hypothetical protein ECANGB1_297 [Enterospora canceri]